jgi:hypothetical protein
MRLSKNRTQRSRLCGPLRRVFAALALSVVVSGGGSTKTLSQTPPNVAQWNDAAKRFTTVGIRLGMSPEDVRSSLFPELSKTLYSGGATLYDNFEKVFVAGDSNCSYLDISIKNDPCTYAIIWHYKHFDAKSTWEVFRYNYMQRFGMPIAFNDFAEEIRNTYGAPALVLKPTTSSKNNLPRNSPMVENKWVDGKVLNVVISNETWIYSEELLNLKERDRQLLLEGSIDQLNIQLPLLILDISSQNSLVFGMRIFVHDPVRSRLVWRGKVNEYRARYPDEVPDGAKGAGSQIRLR